MTSEKKIGRIIGILMLAHLAIGLFLPFFLLHQFLQPPPDFLETTAPNASQLRTCVFLLFIGSAVPIAVATLTLAYFSRFSSPMAYWLLAISVAGFTLQAVDNSALMSMLSLSQQYAQSDAAKRELLQTVALATGAARKWAHYSALLLAVSWIAMLSALLLRFRIIPRVLAAITLVAALAQICSVTLRGFLGYPPETRLAMPLAPAYIAVALWLIVKGFREQPAPPQDH